MNPPISEEELACYKQRSSASKLWEYLDHIVQLKDAKVTYVQIKSYLEKQGVETSVQNIRQFYERSKGSRQQREIKQNTDISESTGMFADLKGKK